MKHRFRDMAANCFILIISTLLILGAAEIAARIVLRDSQAGHRPFEPYFTSGDGYMAGSQADLLTMGESPAEYGYERVLKTYVYSPAGPARPSDRADFLFRHSLSRYSPEKVAELSRSAESSVRIFVIGGSAAQGHGASGKDKSWHAILEADLRRRFERDDIYVFNGAMGAFVSTQERIAFDLAAAPLRPDLTLIMNGFNDMYIPLIFGVRPGDPYQTGYRYQQIYDSSAISYLFENSALFAHTARRLSYRALVENGDRILADKKAAWSLGQGVFNVYTNNVSYLIGRGTEESPVLAFFQPWRDQARVEAGLQPLSRNHWFYQNLANAIKRRFKDNGRFVDISSAMSGKQSAEYFLDLAHVNDNGQKILAGAVYPHVEREVERILAKKTVPGGPSKKGK